jgi:hypothetical protein
MQERERKIKEDAETSRIQVMELREINEKTKNDT